VPVNREEIHLRTRGETEVIDITDRVRRIAASTDAADGVVHIFAPGATAGLTTIEYEPGCVRDLQEALERVVPRHADYHHNERWGDGNGFSHIRAALLGPSLSVPMADGELMLGTWQQIVLVDFDNRARDRRLVVTVTGE
jgi:secondary thiamine-phosphate synthase enzyme